MNGRRAKQLRRVAYGLAAQWLRSMVPEDQKHNVTRESVKEFEKGQEKYVSTSNKVILSAYSSRWFLKKLKKAIRKKEAPDFTINSTEELGDF